MIAKILKKGDTIGIISPSSILRDSEDIEVMNNSIKIFEEMGYLILFNRRNWLWNDCKA